MLFPWARAEVFAREHGARILQPAWNTVRIGPYLRREPDKRYYLGFFQASHHVCGLARLCAMARGRRISEEAAAFPGPAAPAGKRPRIAVFRGLGEYFTPILFEYAFVRRQLWAMTRPALRPAISLSADPFIAMHVRRGDLTRQGLSPDAVIEQPPFTPMPWFVAMAATLRRHAELDRVPIVVFTDGSPDEIVPLLQVPNVHVRERNSAITDLWALAHASLLFASGYSTFSMWASYLGGMPTIYAPGKVQQRVQEGRPHACELELTADGGLPRELVLRTANGTAAPAFS